MKKTALELQMQKLGPWFHNLHLSCGLQTAPEHPLGDFPSFKWQQISSYLPADLTGWKVLDIGCNAGFYSFELTKRGASVVGIDYDSRYLRQARWAARVLALQPSPVFRRKTIYELARGKDMFDLVLFMGVFYHLRYPLLGLDIAARKTRRLLLFQSLTIPDVDSNETCVDHAGHLGRLGQRDEIAAPGWPRMAFIEGSFAGDPTNWWIPNRSAIRSMLRSSGLKVIAEPEEETFICEPLGLPTISPFAEADYQGVTHPHNLRKLLGLSSNGHATESRPRVR
jgi:tRNA (mo5U34)-methyltransferase